MFENSSAAQLDRASDFGSEGWGVRVLPGSPILMVFPGITTEMSAPFTLVSGRDGHDKSEANSLRLADLNNNLLTLPALRSLCI